MYSQLASKFASKAQSARILASSSSSQPLWMKRMHEGHYHLLGQSSSGWYPSWTLVAAAAASVVAVVTAAHVFPSRLSNTRLQGNQQPSSCLDNHTNKNEESSSTEERLTMWTKKWSSGQTRWHKKVVHPLLEKYFEPYILRPFESKAGHKHQQKPLRILVPLCGKTVDMAYLATIGNNDNGNSITESKPRIQVVGVDCVRQAITEFAQEHPQLEIQKHPASSSECDDSCFEQYIGKSILLLQGDFFQLGSSSARAAKDDHGGPPFDAAWDRAALIAIQPEHRADYVRVMERVMAPGSIILLSTLVRPHGDRITGPPFSLDEDQVRDLYENQPWVESVECVEAFYAFAQEPWYIQLGAYFLFHGYAQEKIFVIRVKK